MARASQSDNDRYSEQETQQRFEKLVRAALDTKPTPLKGVPKKWSGAKRSIGRGKKKDTRDSA
jgi:hypothetical protein